MIQPSSFAIGYDTDELFEQAQKLAQQYHLIIDNDKRPRLQVTQDKLVLLTDDFLPLYVDFFSTNIQRRQKLGKQQGLVRACKPMAGTRIIDATAGWGRDAGLLASFGAHVLMLERQVLMAALLTDALTRLGEHNGLLSLLLIDAKQYLQSLLPKDYPDVIYIDPMHPVRQKSALVKKDMQILQRLFSADNDALSLIELAITKARCRVVVKWPQRLAALVTPDCVIEGKTVRFDVYWGLERNNLT